MSAPQPRDRRGAVGLFGAVGISLLWTRMSFLALPWYVLATTGSPTRTGLVSFAEMAPYVLVQALGGPLIDRVGAWRTSIAGDVVAAVGVGLVPALHTAGLLPLPALALLVAAAGAARGAGDAARDVLVPGVGEAARMPMERAAGVYDGVNRLATLVGAPLAGVLIAATSPLLVLALDALTFAASAILVVALVAPSAQPPPLSTPVTVRAYGRSLREGFRHLRADRLLLGIATMVFVTNLVDQAGGAVLTPVWAVRVAHSAVALGLVSGAFAGGAVVGNLATTWLGPRLPRRLGYGVGFLLAGAPRYVALAFAATVSPVLPVFFLGGLGAGGINPILGAVEYERVPRALQARVLGVVGALAWAGIPIGSLLGGALVGVAGLRTTLLLAAGVYLITTLAPFAFPAWRGMERAGQGSLSVTGEPGEPAGIA